MFVCVYICYRATDRAVEPLKSELVELDQLIREQQDKICAVRSNILKNEDKIQKMVTGINFSSRAWSEKQDPLSINSPENALKIRNQQCLIQNNGKTIFLRGDVEWDQTLHF